MKPKISIILPCYNVEKYIKRCAKSLIEQSIGIENLELIFVNDASTDSTLSMLSEIEQEYPDNILVINMPENRKQGAARNIGLKYANADYIGFVDSDDWIEPDMYEKLYSKMQEYNCDLVSCYIFEDYPNGTSIGIATGNNAFFQINTIEERKKFSQIDSGGGVCCKLYHKSLIIDNGILFPEQLKYEDNYWNSMISLHCSSIYVLKENLYHYSVNPGSTVQSRNALHHLDRLNVEMMKIDTYKEKGVFDIYNAEIELEFLNLFYVNTLFIIFTKFDLVPINIIHYMQETVLDIFPNYKSNPYFIEDPNKYHSVLNTIELDWSGEQWNMFAEEYRKIIHNE
ncbi:putative glycosyltransferase EpsH [Clostridium puniceum]|uniref:Putative glycosyltransferase EpsH n=1 Tax=Clostridium puniceum TaxID=29367 RepID=A0A1S8TBL9_9CLOT|nr:glycosyltransferase family 2 protein [Clostridium puniceum]OOM75011.1 putative glycosyltransferase EpsH [Clostridium puniceum]